MIIWITRELASAIHERQLSEHGGTGVRDESLLQSALARPRQLFACGDPPPDLAALAASLAYGLANTPLRRWQQAHRARVLLRVPGTQ